MSQFGTGSVAGVIVQPDREFAGYAEGIIRAWNPSTFEHTINVRGTDLHNIDVCSGIEALTYQPGDMVIVTRWKPRSRKGTATYRIGNGGRIIRPGTGAAEAAISALRTNIATQLSAEILGDRWRVDSASGTVSTSSNSFVALSGGPEVTDVPISPAGIAVAWVGFRGSATSQTAGFGQALQMGIQVTGATSRSPDEADVFELNHLDADQLSAAGGRGMATIVYTGLNEGLHDFSARYAQADPNGETAFFEHRSIAVLGL